MLLSQMPIRPRDSIFMPVQKPYQTNLLIAGYDEGTGPSLYWMDYLATMHSMNIAGTGYGNLFIPHMHLYAFELFTA